MLTHVVIIFKFNLISSVKGNVFNFVVLQPILSISNFFNERHYWIIATVRRFISNVTAKHFNFLAKKYTLVLFILMFIIFWSTFLLFLIFYHVLFTHWKISWDKGCSNNFYKLYRQTLHHCSHFLLFVEIMLNVGLILIYTFSAY